MRELISSSQTNKLYLYQYKVLSVSGSCREGKDRVAAGEWGIS